jgi:translation initiation factor 1 (eIF-1/SUI1)
MSRKGHGGKTVTEVSGVTSGHDALVAAIKSAMGVGARCEDAVIVVQGDQVARLAPWLEARGARVVRG